MVKSSCGQKGKTIDDVVVIGVEEGRLYKLKGHADLALMTSTVSPCELWHRRLAHIHYKALPIVSKVVRCLPLKRDCLPLKRLVFNPLQSHI